MTCENCEDLKKTIADQAAEIADLRRRLHIRQAERAREEQDRAAEFARFHATYPEVYAKIVEMARALKLNGYSRFGTKAIMERIRWVGGKKTAGLRKLNNSYTAFYARLIMAENEDLVGFFEVRGGGDPTPAELEALGQLPLDLA